MRSEVSQGIEEADMKTAHLDGRTCSGRGSRRGLLVLLLLASCSRAESTGPFEEGLTLRSGPTGGSDLVLRPRYRGRSEAEGGWLYRGRAYGETKNDGEAFRSYDQALRLDPCYAEALFQRGRTHLWEGSPEQAIREY